MGVNWESIKLGAKTVYTDIPHKSVTEELGPHPIW